MSSNLQEGATCPVIISPLLFDIQHLFIDGIDFQISNYNKDIFIDILIRKYTEVQNDQLSTCKTLHTFMNNLPRYIVFINVATSRNSTFEQFVSYTESILIYHILTQSYQFVSF